MKAITTSTIENICESIKNTPPQHLQLMVNVMNWRDAEPGIIRKVICGAALVVSGLFHIIDAVGSLVLAILTVPVELFGIHLAISFAARSFKCGLFGGMCLSFFQFDNIVEPDLDSKISQRLLKLIS